MREGCQQLPGILAKGAAQGPHILPAAAEGGDGSTSPAMERPFSAFRVPAGLISTTDQHRPLPAGTDARDKHLAPQPGGAHLKPDPRSPRDLGLTGR